MSAGMSGKKVKGEEARLGLERLRQTVIPEHKIGAGDLLYEGDLGGDHAFGETGRQVADFDETPSLGLGGAGDDDDFIEMRLSGGFK
jgi:hypothetical protein